VQPKRVGGAEFDYVALVDCADALGQADASVAWNFANLASPPLDAGHVDKRAQDLVWNKDPERSDCLLFIFPPVAPEKSKVDMCWGEAAGLFLGGGFSEWNMLAKRCFVRRRSRRYRIPDLSGLTKATIKSRTRGILRLCGKRVE